MFSITQFEDDRFGVVFGSYPHDELKTAETFEEFERLIRSDIPSEYPTMNKTEYRRLQLIMIEYEAMLAARAKIKSKLHDPV